MCLNLGFSQQVMAQGAENEPNTAVAQLVTLLSAERTLKADVELLVLDQDGRGVQESSARLMLEKPDYFYWQIVAPYEELMIINQQRIWLYEPDLDQVTIQPFDDDLSSTPLLLLNGDAEALAAAYQVSVSELEGGKTDFLLFPLDPGSLITQLNLNFNENSMLEQMHFENSLGQKTSLSFTNVESNPEIPASTFIFDIPPGIEVIDSTGD